MGAPRAESFSMCGTNFVQYVFQAGDVLPLHEHVHDHGTIVLAGSVEVFDDHDKTMPLSAGERVMFKAGRKHGVRALVNGTVILNVMPPFERGDHG